VRSLAEDPSHDGLLYVGTELGLFVGVIRAGGPFEWLELGVELPTLAINDLVVHERDNDLVLGTHGRGIWILDRLDGLQALVDHDLSAPALFPVGPARMERRATVTGSVGDAIFRGENPPQGALLDYWLPEALAPEEEPSADEPPEKRVSDTDQNGTEGDAEETERIHLEIRSSAGEVVRELEPTQGRGVNRIVWDLRHESLSEPRRSEPEERSFDRGPRRPAGPLVVPGTYLAVLEVDGQEFEVPVQVNEDPRIELSGDARREWTERQRKLVDLYEKANALLIGLLPPEPERTETALTESDVAESDLTESDITEPDEIAQPENSPTASDPPSESDQEAIRIAEELRDRIFSLYREVGSWTGPVTSDQALQESFFAEKLEELTTRFGRETE
jgi:hypothetical protein